MKLSEAIKGFTIWAYAEGYSPLTVAAYQSSLGLLVTFLENKNIEEITETDLRSFFGYIRNTYISKTGKELSTASHHRYWKSIRALFKWAETELSIGRPDLVIRMPRHNNKEIVPFSEDDIKKLIAACDYSAPIHKEDKKTYQFKRHTAIRDKAIILVLLDTGVRVGELTRLRIKDVNLENGAIQVLPYRIGKTKPRVVIIGKLARKMLWKYLNDRGECKPDDPLFINATEKGSSRYSIRALLDKLGNRAGVPEVHPHRFRHTFAIEYLRNGGDVFTLQRFLGHSTLEMVKKYLTLAQTDAANAHRRASPVDNLKL